MSLFTTAINIITETERTKGNIIRHIASAKLPDDINSIILGDVEAEENPFYFCYASLFTEVNARVIDSLNIAGYFYFRYLIVTDALADNSMNASGNFKHLIRSNFYHEASIRLLSRLFNDHPAFWQYWEIRKAEYLSAFKTDKKFLTSLSDSDFRTLADNKSANGKVAIDALLILGAIHAQEYKTLLLSHKLFSCGFQYYDDVLDIKQDILGKQTNIALCELQKTISPEVFSEKLNDPDGIVGLIYVNGIADILLKKSIACFEEAENTLGSINCDLWKQVIKSKKKEVESILKNVEFYIETLKIKVRLSNKKLPVKNDFKTGIKSALLNGTNFIVAEQEENGSWKDSPVNAWLSGYWATGYVLNALAPCDKKMIAKINTALAVDYLQQKTSSLWPYIEGWVEDADSTNFALLGLLANNQSAQGEIQKLLTYQREDGGFTTYNNGAILMDCLSDPEIKNVQGWVQSHVCVSAGTLLLLSKFEGFENEKNKLINYLLENVSENKLWDSYWWTSPIYATSLIIEAATRLTHAGLKKAAEKAAARLLQQQQKNGLFGDSFNDRHIFYSTLVLNSICSNKKLLAKYKDQMQVLAGAILENQNEDGSWDSSYALRVPAADCFNPKAVTAWKKSDLGQNVIIEDIHRLITTSTAISALSRYEQG